MTAMRPRVTSPDFSSTLLTWCGVWLLALAMVRVAREAILDAPPTALPPSVPIVLLPAPGAVFEEGVDEARPLSSSPTQAPEPAALMADREDQRQLRRSRIPASVPPERIIIPALELDAPVVPIGWQVVTNGGVSLVQWEVADYAAGWHRDSALPGQAGNIVLSGHHNIRGEVFRDLTNLQEGDEITLAAEGRDYRYAVTTVLILPERGMPLAVRLENARWIAPTRDERLTLVTCWPYTSNTHRVIVVATPAYS